jgi:hypothetical protein
MLLLCGLKPRLGEAAKAKQQCPSQYPCKAAELRLPVRRLSDRTLELEKAFLSDTELGGQ